jgi:murein DD-endopeptidase MepM/ murein hydrolase activator NlpD
MAVLEKRWPFVLVVGMAASCATPMAPTRVGPLSPTHKEPTLMIARHKVKKGQTLYRIALTYEIPLDQLMAVNKIDDPRELKEGEELLIPGASESRAVPESDDDTKEPVASSRPSPDGASMSQPRRPSNPVRAGREDGILEWPVRGVLYARFGTRGKEPHDGIDLAAPAGTPVKTAAAGTVLFAGEQKGYGLIVIVEHDKSLMSLYAHNRDLRVTTNQKVRPGQVVATVGDSGKTSGPHLHFEVRKEGVPVDPLDLLGPVPSSGQ